MITFKNKEQALEYCFDRVTPSIIKNDKDYNYIKQYMYRYRRGMLGEKGVARVFKFFNIKEECTYSINKEKYSLQ